MSGTAQLAQLAAVGLTATVMVMLLVVALEHVRRVRRERRDAARRAELSPVLLDLLDGEEPGPDDGGRVLDEMALELLPQLRGADRQALRELLVDRGVVDRAAAACRSRRPWRRAQAAVRLGAAGAHPHLLHDLLQDPVAGVRIAAARALGRSGDPDVTPELLGALGAPRALPTGVVAMAVLDLGVAALPALRAAAAGGAAGARAVAVELLGWHGDVGAVPVLRRTARSVDEPLALRRLAVESLGRIGDPAAMVDLVQLSRPGSHPALRTVALTALGRVGHPDALRHLRNALADTDADRYDHPAVRTAAADALVLLGREGRELLERCSLDRGELGALARSALPVALLGRSA